MANRVTLDLDVIDTQVSKLEDQRRMIDTQLSRLRDMRQFVMAFAVKDEAQGPPQDDDDQEEQSDGISLSALAESILRRMGTPKTTGELSDLLERHGHAARYKNFRNSLYMALRRSEQFVQTEAGWKLREWEHDDPPPRP